jgi:hypothetical protein
VASAALSETKGEKKMENEKDFSPEHLTSCEYKKRLSTPVFAIVERHGLEIAEETFESFLRGFEPQRKFVARKDGEFWHLYSADATRFEKRWEYEKAPYFASEAAAKEYAALCEMQSRQDEAIILAETEGVYCFLSKAEAEACVAALKSGDDEQLDACFAAEIIL